MASTTSGGVFPTPLGGCGGDDFCTWERSLCSGWHRRRTALHLSAVHPGLLALKWDSYYSGGVVRVTPLATDYTDG